MIKRGKKVFALLLFIKKGEKVILKTKKSGTKKKHFWCNILNFYLFFIFSFSVLSLCKNKICFFSFFFSLLLFISQSSIVIFFSFFFFQRTIKCQFFILLCYYLFFPPFATKTRKGPRTRLDEQRAAN